MFNQLMKRSNAVWAYSTGRFAEERRTFLSDLIERGLSVPEAIGHSELAAVTGAASAKKLREAGAFLESLRDLTALPPAVCVAELLAKVRLREYLLVENPS